MGQVLSICDTVFRFKRQILMVSAVLMGHIELHFIVVVLVNKSKSILCNTSDLNTPYVTIYSCIHCLFESSS